MIKDRMRKALSKLWTGRCDVVNYVQVEDNDTNITSTREVTVLSNIPCRISFELSKEAQQTEAPSKVEQNIKMFVSNDINIPVGSKVIVTQNGITGIYKASSIAATYTSHQEILLDIFKGWS